jgi:hypothetical protein
LVAHPNTEMVEETTKEPEEQRSLDASKPKGLYATADDALKKIASEYEHWSGKLTDVSLQMCYALIGANWVVFGSINGILKSSPAKWSLVMVLLALASNVVGALVLSESLRRILKKGEGDLDRWAAEFKESTGKDVAWPFTDFVDSVGRLTRFIKGCFTIAAGVIFIIGAICKL